MIIIVEGPDGAGKTTLINQLLSSHPGSTTQHFGAPKTEKEAWNYWEVYAAAIEQADKEKVTIFDRCWLSDMVYGPVMRNRCEMHALHADLLESSVIAHGGGFVIYCTAPTKVLWQRCQKRGESYIRSIEVLDSIATRYKEVMRGCHLPVIRYDTAVRW